MAASILLKNILCLATLVVAVAGACAQAQEKSDPPVSPQPVASPPPDSTLPNRPYRVQMRLSGSSCFACLKELEKKIRGIDGVMKVKVDYPGDSLYAHYSAPGASWALATIDYVPARAQVEVIKQVVKTQGYHPFKIIDKGPL